MTDDGPRVLVVEDEDAVRLLISRVLEKRGYRVTALTDGAQALEFIQERKGGIDLVIADLMLPKINGASIAEQIRQLDPQAKIILISGYMDHGLEDSGIDFLQKPFTPSTLIEKVEAVMAAC